MRNAVQLDSAEVIHLDVAQHSTWRENKSWVAFEVNMGLLPIWIVKRRPVIFEIFRPLLLHLSSVDSSEPVYTPL